MKKLISACVFFLINCLCFSQKQANIWHFGDSLSINFSSGVPISIPGSAMTTFEGCASYCNKFGDLLFYTNGGGREPAYSGQDGGHIWDKNNNVMYDMQGIEGGGFSSRQSSVIIEAPGEDSVYYVFTMDEDEYYIGASPATQAAQPLGRGLSYFKVNMHLNGGLGAVTVPNVNVYKPSYEGLCAIRHANKRDYWILINQDTTGIGVYSFTNSGVSFSGKYTGFFGGGAIKGSPDGSKVFAYLGLFNFNNATGQLSNPVRLSSAIDNCEFSPNSRFLYTSQDTLGDNKIVRYDLNSLNIMNSATILGNTSLSGFSFTGILQLGPDGNIYYVAGGGSSLNRINCPNTLSSSVQYDIFTYLGSDPFFDLPNYPGWLFENYDSIFVSLGPDTVKLCEVGGSYTLNAGNPGAAYLWSTGATTQTITTNVPGKYYVNVTGACGTGKDTVVILSCALPLNLLNFNATGINNKNVLLRWQTATESNTSHFNIQRSSNAGTFTNIGKVAAAGNSSNKLHYSFTDKEPNTGINYYRLQMVDKDGSFTYSNILSVNIKPPLGISIHPNPVSDLLHIQFSNSKTEKVTLQIANAQGQVLLQQYANALIGINSFTVNTSNLAKGMYIFSITNHDLQNKIFIKE